MSTKKPAAKKSAAKKAVVHVDAPHEHIEPAGAVDHNATSAHPADVISEARIRNGMSPDEINAAIDAVYARRK